MNYILSRCNNCSDFLLPSEKRVLTQPAGTVAFSAGLTQQVSLTPNTSVAFDRVWLNIGDGYDNTTGIFTCPVAGTYVFMYSGLAESVNMLPIFNHLSHRYAKNRHIKRIEKAHHVAALKVAMHRSFKTNNYNDNEMKVYNFLACSKMMNWSSGTNRTLSVSFLFILYCQHISSASIIGVSYEGWPLFPSANEIFLHSLFAYHLQGVSALSECRVPGKATYLEQ